MKWLWMLGLLAAGVVVAVGFGWLPILPQPTVDSPSSEVGATSDAPVDSPEVPRQETDGLPVTRLPWTAPSEGEIAVALAGLSFHDFAETSFRLYLLRFPQQVTRYGLAAWFGIRNDGLDDYSPAYTDETRRIERAVLNQLRAFDVGDLSQADRALYETCVSYWSGKVQAQRLADARYAVTPSYDGSPDWQLYDLMTVSHPGQTLEDIEDYMVRLSRVETQIDQLIAAVEAQQSRGIVAPKCVLERARELLMIMGYTQIEQHPFFSRLALMVVANPGISNTVKRLIFADAAHLIESSVRPAYRRLIGKIAQLEKMAPSEDSPSTSPDSYDEVLGVCAGEGSPSAPVLHGAALAEVLEIQQEILLAGSSLWPTEAATVQQVLQRADASRGPISDSGIPAAFMVQLSRADAMASGGFSNPIEAPVEVSAQPVLSARYSPSAMDGTRSARLLVPQSGSVPGFLVPTLTYREGYPGMHVLATSRRRAAALPLIQRVMSAALEQGWAAYAERLAWELGAYQDDPYGNLGRLAQALDRAVLAAVDTGLHANQWTIDQAILFIQENSAQTEEQAKQAVVLALAEPGLFVPAFLGSQDLLKLRDQLASSQKDKFDLTAFHALVLDSGATSLAELRSLIEARSESGSLTAPSP